MQLHLRPHPGGAGLTTARLGRLSLDLHAGLGNVHVRRADTATVQGAIQMFRRSPDPVSPVASLGFTALGLVLLIGHGSLHVQPRRVWPGVLAVLALALLPGIRGHRDDAVDPPPPPPAAPPASGAGGAAEGL
ncbi:MAG: hypothetical protein QOE72_3979 [Chloroflexota bacterium]|nr:hypothetical protein [Chloroflexota bacterium]